MTTREWASTLVHNVNPASSNRPGDCGDVDVGVGGEFPGAAVLMFRRRVEKFPAEDDGSWDAVGMANTL